MARLYNDVSMTRRVRTKIGLLIISINATVSTSASWAQEALQPTLGTSDDREGADVFGAVKDSLKLLLIEHASRIAFQEKTRRELAGNFWLDYRRSVRVPRQWGD